MLFERLPMILLLVPFTPLAALQADGRDASVIFALEFQRPGVEAPQGLLDLPARIDLEEVAIPDALRAIGDHAGVPLAFSPSRLDGFDLVTCNCLDDTVGRALQKVLAGTPFRFFEFQGRILIEPEGDLEIVEAQAQAVTALPLLPIPTRLARNLGTRHAGPDVLQAPQRNGTIVGVVSDSRGQRPLPGVQVFLEGTGIGGLTNQQGRFTMANVPAGEVTLTAQLIGYSSFSEVLQVNSGETLSLNIELRQRALDLGEIVVTGTAAATERRSIGNSLASISATDVMERAPVGTFQEILQARTPGVSMLHSSGQVGMDGDLRIRGSTSVTQSNQPLVYIDGVRTSTSSDALGVGGQAPTRMSDLDPSDIERIEIVKGAAATSLYGTQAASGVIQIFTKRGRTGAPVWNFQIDQGIERTPTGRGLLGSLHFPGQLWPNFVGPDGTQARAPSEIVESGYQQSYSLSVGGGQGPVTYFGSLGWQDHEGSPIPETNWLKRFTGRGNLSVALSDRLSLDLNSGFVDSRLRMPDNDNALHGNWSQVISGVPYTATADRPFGERWGSWQINRTVETFQEVRRFSGGVTLDHSPWDFLGQRLTVGIDWYGQEDDRFFPYGFQGSGNRFGFKNSRQRSYRDITVDYRARFTHQLRPDVSSELAVGFQANFERDHRTSAQGRDFPAPGVTLVSAAAVTFGDEFYQEDVNAGVFVQETLGFGDRLFFTLGLRVDGNSAFGDQFDYQTYPRASLAYTISDEDFWPTDLFQTTRFRIAYGEAGRAPAQFAADQTFTPIASEAGEPAVTPLNIGDPNLGPERSRELELGFDAATWDDRVGIEFTYFNQRTVDALMPRQFPPSLGFGQLQLSNVGEIRNQGLEFAVNARLVTMARFDWDMNFQISRNSSEVVDLGDTAPFGAGGDTRIVVGYPVTGQWSRQSLGWNPETRRHIPSDTAVYVGQGDPTSRGALSSNWGYGPFALSATVDWARGHSLVNFSRGWAIGKLTGDEYLALLEAPSGARTPAADSLLNLWQTVGNDGFVERADFIKFRELSLSYQISPEHLERFRITRASIRVSGRNLLSYAPHWSGPDPETRSQGQSNLSRRADFNTTPIPRRLLFSIRGSF